MSQHYVIVVTKDGEVPVPVPSPEDNEDGKPTPVSVDVSHRVGKDSVLQIGKWEHIIGEFNLPKVVGWYRTVKGEEDEDV